MTTPLKHPLQALLIAPDHAMRTAILRGRKSITVREGHRDYRPGPVMLCCEKVPWTAMVDVTSVRHCLLREVSAEELADDGFYGLEDAVAQLRRFYAHITADSPVTVLRWTNARGLLVENADIYEYDPSSLYSHIVHD